MVDIAYYTSNTIVEYSPCISQDLTPRNN